MRKIPMRKLKRVRAQCRYGCCRDMGNWRKYFQQKSKGL